MSRSFTFECGCCGETDALRKFRLPDGWMLIYGQTDDVLMCGDCARKAAEKCEHKDEKHVEGMYVQCQACGRQRYVVML
jgi:hypothetical protein